MNEVRPLLSVVVPVFNQASSIVDNLEVISERISGRARTAIFEIVVVSDGSIDATEDELLGEAGAGAFRVFHYDRNLGKGYAVKLGALEALGDWIGFVDADLDLDPADLPATFAVRRSEGSTSRSARSGTRTRRCTTHSRASPRPGCSSSLFGCSSGSTSGTPRSG